ncbi:MAG: D-inositol-3-phosphate glycosyltransferase [Saprospiraceae bacterium]|nr:D-inositol-3-phosphate glycosyltransferase [Saprospiraceae bacterium]
MNVLLLNTYPHGGAGVACRRLQTALQASGVKANLLTANDTGVRWPFYAERLSFLPYERDKSVRFSFSLANFGKNLAQHPLVREADVLHLHWVNQGFLSLKNIRQLAETGKSIVWTLHDMWAFTGGCHYSRGCDHFLNECGDCPFLKHPAPGDLSNSVWRRKRELFPQNIQFVTCSEWLAGVARSSGLLKNYPVAAIPNPIDTVVFKPLTAAERQAFRSEKGIATGAHVLLFAAMKVGETRKGFQFLLEALQILRAQKPDFPLEILVLGKAEPEALAALPYPVHALGLVQELPALVQAYGAADVFVIPSLEDNLPNTVMESLACGTPVAGFATGGIPEMVGHLQEGYIAPQGDSGALAEGIYEILKGGKSLDVYREAARVKAVKNYSNAEVAKRYLEIYLTPPQTPSLPATIS